MPLEIEIKLKVESHGPIRKRVREANAEYIGEVRETNIFFDKPDRSLLAANCGLRVRLTTAKEDPIPKALLTFKGPRQPSGLRSREAYDLQLTPHDQIIPLLTALGYMQILLFEKDRESWRLDECLIELDTLPHFGTFLEIEGPSENQVLAVQKKLDLARLPLATPGYSEMVAQFLRQDDNRKELRF